MIITCGECDSSFVLDDSLIKSSGSKVRCSNCRNIFVAYPESPESKPVVARAPKPVRSPEPKPVPKKIVEPRVVEQAAPAMETSLDDDPDLTKAVEAISEDELDFTDEELGINSSTVSPRTETPRMEKMPEPAAVPAPDVKTSAKADSESDFEEEEVLDFSDFELDMDEEDLPSDMSAESTVDELGLEFDDKMSADESAAESDMDFDLESDEEEELDFSDLELEMGGEPPAKDADQTEELGASMGPVATDTADTMVVEDAELDFSDLDLDEDASDDVSPPSADDDFNLDLDNDTVEKTETLMIDDELDFSDLERELDGSFDGADDEPASVDDLDLDLSEDNGPETSETVLMDEEDLDFSDFEFDLEEDKTPEEERAEESEAIDKAAEEELDFSNLANFLDSDEPPPDLPAGDDDLELALDMDLDSDASPDKSASAPDDDKEELDFSDLENLLDGLDDSEEHRAAGHAEDIKLELDDAMDEDDELDFEPPKGKAKVAAEDDLDFSDVEAMLGSDDEDDDLDLALGDDDDAELAFEEGDSDLDLVLDDDEDSDIELELDLGNEDASDESDEEAFEDMPEMGDDSEKQTKGIKGEDKKKVKKTAKRKAKGKAGMIVKLIIALVIILGLLFVGLYLSKDKIEHMTGFVLPIEIAPLESLRNSISDMDIPVVSSWVKSEPKDPQGRLLLKTSGITGKIVTSPTLGDLFVISGKVQNNYSSTRNSISLVGKLIGEGGKVVQSKLFYAGNIIAEEELMTLDEDIIKKRLQNRLGDNGMNAKVRPGQMIPFMVVFTNLNESLTEFSVETGGSFQGAAIK